MKVTCKHTIFNRTESGKTWQRKPVETYTDTMIESVYKSCVSKDTIRFFKGLGGSEHAVKSYTTFGFLVTRLTSCSPDGTIKHVREFSFEE